MYTIFYSWQSDLPGKYNRSFIGDCLQKALNNLNKSDDYIVELNLDRDTKGEPGTPDIVNTIFKKITNSNIFVCDISIINQGSETRKMPNPNVLLELGYAASILGWENVVCVYNTSFGKVEDLPFDLKFRRPILYQYNDTNQKDKDGLIKQLEAAIKSSNPETIEEKRRIKIVLSGETEKAIKIALEKPAHWEYKFCEELMTSNLSKINSKCSDIERGIHFKKPIELDIIGFLDVIGREISNLSKTLSALNVLLAEDLLASFGPPGQAGNVFSIYNTVNKIFKMLDNVLELEIEFRSLKVPPQMEELQNLLFGNHQKIINEMNTLPGQLNDIYSGKSKKIHLTMELDLDGANAAMNLYRTNISLLQGN